MKVVTESGSVYWLDVGAKTILLPDGRTKIFRRVVGPELGRSLYVEYPDGRFRRTTEIVEIDGKRAA